MKPSKGSKGTAKFVEKFYDDKTLRDGKKQMLVHFQCFDNI